MGCSRVPWAATVFADLIFASSGFLNVVLYTATRPNLRPHRDRHEQSSLMLSTHIPREPYLDTPNNTIKRDTSEVTSDLSSQALGRQSDVSQ